MNIDDNLEKTSGEHSENSQLNQAKPKENQGETSNNQKQTPSEPTVIAVPRKKATFGIKTTPKIKGTFMDLAAKAGETHEGFLIQLMKSYTSAPKTVEVEKEVEKVVEVEKIVEVEKRLNENQAIVVLSENERKVLNVISQKRFLQGTRKAKQGESISPESYGEILRKSFFNEGRLFNQDNVFYTGLTSNDLNK
jgi:hypothetical protein